MAKLLGMNRVAAAMQVSIDNTLRTKVSAYVTRSMLERLFAQEQLDGSEFPKKFKTKSGAKVRKQYERNGWDTQHFLIASGKSYPLKTKFANHTLEVWPQGYDILKYHSERVQWMGLTEEQKLHITDLINEDLRRAFR